MKKLVLTALLLSSPAIAAEPQADPSIALATMSAKLNNLEEENRKLTGKVDELQHQLEQVQNKAVADAAKAASSPTQPILVGQSSPNSASAAADGSTVIKATPYVTKVIPAEEESENSTTADEFDEVFKSVVAEDYKTAKPALKGFITKHPSTSLSGEAYFWLGEIAWSERDFNNAAIYYLKGYKEAPTGNKASENILKMALTLKELKKNEEACKYLGRFDTEFPNAHSDLKSKATNAKTELGCK